MRVIKKQTLESVESLEKNMATKKASISFFFCVITRQKERKTKVASKHRLMFLFGTLKSRFTTKVTIMQ